MSNLISMKVTGFKELMDTLRQFPDKVVEGIERKGTLAGAKIVRDDAKLRFNAWFGGKPGTGRTKRNIKARKLKAPSKWQVIYGVGISRYGMFAELGTKGHIIKAKRKRALAATYTFESHIDNTIGQEYEFFGKTVKHPGTSAKPHLRPAFYNNIDRIIEAERKVLNRLIEKEVVKRAKP